MVWATAPIEGHASDDASQVVLVVDEASLVADVGRGGALVELKGMVVNGASCGVWVVCGGGIEGFCGADVGAFDGRGFTEGGGAALELNADGGSGLEIEVAESAVDRLPSSDRKHLEAFTDKAFVVSLAHGAAREDDDLGGQGAGVGKCKIERLPIDAVVKDGVGLSQQPTGRPRGRDPEVGG